MDIKKLDSNKENILKKGWEYRDFSKKFYSKRINFYNMNKDTIKKLTIEDRNKFIEEIKDETDEILEILKQNDS